MKKLSLVALIGAVGLMLASTVMAQPQFTPPTAESLTETLNTAVTLTAAQRPQILKAYTAMLAEAEAGGGMGGGMMMMGGRGMGGGTLPESISKILTADQVKKYAEYNIQQSVDRTLTQIDTAVTLTADQKTKVAAAIRKQVIAQNELRASMTAGGDMQAMMEKMTPIREAMTKEINAILTPDQQKKYADMPQRGMGGMGGGMGGAPRGN